MFVNAYVKLSYHFMYTTSLIDVSGLTYEDITHAHTLYLCILTLLNATFGSVGM